MSIKTKIQLLFLAFVILCCYSCIKTTSTSPLPVIAFKDFIKFGTDSAFSIITFKDGDGDIGRQNITDTTPPYNAKSEYAYDLWMIYYYKGVDGKFHRYFSAAQNDSMALKFHLPYLTPTEKNKSLTGEIRTVVNAPYYIIGASPEHKIIKFDIYVYDRGFHKSNIISTPEIPVP